LATLENPLQGIPADDHAPFRIEYGDNAG
jgi:hypothetical protein